MIDTENHTPNREWLIETAIAGAKILNARICRDALFTVSVILRCGRKKLELTLIGEESVIHATDYIVNIDKYERRIDGETTALYLAAKRIFEHLATTRNKCVNYLFVTGNNHMMCWGKNQGVEVFSWEKQMPNDAEHFSRVTAIHPGNDSSTSEAIRKVGEQCMRHSTTDHLQSDMLDRVIAYARTMNRRKESKSWTCQ